MDARVVRGEEGRLVTPAAACTTLGLHRHGGSSLHVTDERIAHESPAATQRRGLVTVADRCLTDGLLAECRAGVLR